MRYLGCKAKLIDFIHATIDKYGIKGHVFCDLFTGTACVADSFKEKYQIIANDFMHYSFCLAKAKLMNNKVPCFAKFKEKYHADIFEWLNKIQTSPSKRFFIYHNYSPAGNRMFFTEDNAIKIDEIRFAIESLYEEKTISEKEYYFLKASLLDCTTKYSNTSGTYEAFFKFWENRAITPFVLEPIDMLECNNMYNHMVYNEDSNTLIRKIKGDILYIDTPYTVTQYASAYNILETISLNDEPIIKGVGGKRGKGTCVSNYCYARKAKAEFEDLFRQAQFPHIIISYSNQGVVPLKELVDLAKVFAKDGIVNVDVVEYQEYQNHRSSNKRNGEKLKEVLIYFQKDISVIKSPLNYAGSKDRMFLNIQKFFPKHIGIFVDVMGGAFNMGVNVYATNSVYYNDINPYVSEIIKWLLANEKNDIATQVETIIEKYHLSKGNECAYNELRAYYNGNKSPLLLFILHMYSFQNYIRFNKAQNYNTPIGVAGYSEDLRNRILLFKPKTYDIHYLSNDFRMINYMSFPKETLFYFDPPYNITNAAYNDGKRGLEGWTEDHETALYQTLSSLNENGYFFILSNVKEHKGKINEKLISWSENNRFNIIDIGMSGWRYAKNEIIVTNF
jgi:adenine-specific DNA-methyltransferase